MSQLIVKTDSQTVLWTESLRFRVGESCEHNDAIWSNLTGINTEPGTSNNWLKVKSLTESSAAEAPFVVVNGNIFRLSKNPLNSDPGQASTLEINDVISCGHWDNDEYWIAARYLGGDINTKGNWQVLSSIEEIPLS